MLRRRSPVVFNVSDPYEGADHVIGGVWGHHVSFMRPLHMLIDPAVEQILIWGHLPDDNPIRVGQCLIHEYQYHQIWARYVITELQWHADPSDLFFGAMMASHIWNPDGELVWKRGLWARLRHAFNLVWRRLCKPR